MRWGKLQKETSWPRELGQPGRNYKTTLMTMLMQCRKWLRSQSTSTKRWELCLRDGNGHSEAEH